jgi:hypothetical protein
MYLVVEWRTTSAPRASGCWSAGVAKVPSTSSSAPRAWASSDSFARSTTFISGFDGVSAQTSRVAGVIAASIAARSAPSTAVEVRPHRGKRSRAMIRLA